MILTKILDFLFPHICIFCSTVGNPVCEKCVQEKFISYPDKNFENDETTYLDNIFINYAYNEPVSKLLFDYKYNGCFSYHKFISELIFRNSKEVLNQNDFITFVPMHRKKQWTRGYNQSELLARSLSKRAKIPLINVLQKAKNTKSQADLNREERLKNLDDAFEINSNISLLDRSVIIIDDVITTGSTLNECAKVLKSVGAREVIGVVFAHSID